MKSQDGWLDTRLHSPSCNHYDIYDVVFESSGMVAIGRCAWMPCDGYKDGKWMSPSFTNGNDVGGEVLYWKANSKVPDRVVRP